MTPHRLDLSLALRLAFAADARARLRHLALVGTALVSCFLLCAAVALPLLALRIEQRLEQRGYAAATSAKDAVMLLRSDTMTAGGAAFPILTIATVPGHDFDPRAIPPGLKTLPPIGGAVISPGLAAAGLTAESFGFTTAAIGTGPSHLLGPEYLAVASERAIIARVPYPMTTPKDGTKPLPAPSAKEGLASGFTPVTSKLPRPHTPLFPSPRDAALLGLALAVSSALALLAAARAAHYLPPDRRRTVTLLGFNDAAIHDVVRTGAVAATAVGATLGLAAWTWFAGASSSVQVAATVLAPESFDLPFPLAWICAAATVGVAYVSARALPSGVLRSVPQRPSAPWINAVAWAVFPVGAALVVASGWLPGPVSSRTAWLGGVAALAVGLPLLTGRLSRGWGSLVRRRDSASGLLAGSFLVRHHGVMVARASALGVTLLLALAVAGSGPALNHATPPVPTRIYTLAWDDGPTTVAKLARKFRLAQFFTVNAKGQVTLPRCGVVSTGGDARNVCFNTPLNGTTQAFFAGTRYRIAPTPLDVNATVDGRIFMLPPTQEQPFEVYSRYAPALGLSVTPVDAPGPDASGTGDDWLRLTLYLICGIGLLTCARLIVVRAADVLAQTQPSRACGVDLATQARAQASPVRVPLFFGTTLALLGGLLAAVGPTGVPLFSVVGVAVAGVVLSLAIAAVVSGVRGAHERRWGRAASR